MNPSPLGPRLLKGAIVTIDLATSKQTTIAFQYNPETLSRTLTQTQTAVPGESGKRATALPSACPIPCCGNCSKIF